MISQVVVHMPLDSLETEFSVGDSTSPTRALRKFICQVVGSLNDLAFSGWEPGIWDFQDIKESTYILNDFQKSGWVFQHSENLSALSWAYLILGSQINTPLTYIDISRNAAARPVNICWWLSVSRASIAEDSPNVLKKYLGGNVCLEHGQIFFSHHHSVSNTSWWPRACHGHWTLEMMESIRENGVGWLWLLQHYLQGTLRTSSGPWRTSVFKVWSSIVD